MQRQVRTTGDVEEDAFRAVDRPLFQQRTADRLLSGLHRSVGPAGDAHPHDRTSHVPHDRADVGKVHIDETRDLNDVGNTLDRLPQHIIGHFKGFP